MLSKEALETIGKTYTDDCQQISDWEEYKLLQELIDKTTICGLPLDEAIPVVEMYRQLKQTTHQLKPIKDLMMGTKGQYYPNGEMSIQELIDENEILEIQNSNLDDEIQMYKKALKNACILAIQNNSGGSYIAISRGTREQYNLPLTLDDVFNEKILNDYLLEQARKELESEKQ